MMNVKRLAAALFVYACGGTQPAVTSAPCPTSPSDASVSVVDAQPDAVVVTSEDAALALVDAGPPEALLDPERGRDVLLATIASLPLKTIPSPPAPTRDPPHRVVPGGMEGRSMLQPLVYETSFRMSEGLPLEVVRRIVRQSYGRFRYCYEELLRTQPDAKGKVVTRFAVARSGDIVLAEPLSSTLTPDLAMCIARAIRTLTFPRTSDAAVVAVEYGLSFM